MPSRTITRAASCARYQAPRRLTFRMRSQLSSLNSRNAPHAQKVVAEPVISRQQLGLLLRRADELLEGVLERSLDALLAVGHVGRPRLVLGQPHALVQDDLEVEPVIAELGHENGLDQVGQAVLLEQGGR